MSSIIEHLMLLGLGSFALAAAACDDTVSLGRESDDGGGAPPAFTPPAEDGGDAALPDRPPALMCIATECPFPYATCSSSDSAYKCGTNLMNDPANCGECDNSCGGFGPINMSASCVRGRCEFECLIRKVDNQTLIFKNCNGIVDDGCEIDVTNDPNNCGLCGHQCGEGERCIEGHCGCTNGRVDCGGYCTDIRSDSSNCGACGNSCGTPPDACNPRPPNSTYGCGNSECGKPICYSDWADCNGDLGTSCSSDGCETNITTDRDNCGGCGIRCADTQECRDVGNGPQCIDTCETMGLTSCASGCRDLLGDRFNCGGCQINCGNPRAGQTVECRKGYCVVDCMPGFADCNGDPGDGCEVDLRTHPANCGGCGIRCDITAGQPCIDGKCLTKECDGGVEVVQ